MKFLMALTILFSAPAFAKTYTKEELVGGAYAAGCISTYLKYEQKNLATPEDVMKFIESKKSECVNEAAEFIAFWKSRGVL